MKKTAILLSSLFAFTALSGAALAGDYVSITYSSQSRFDGHEPGYYKVHDSDRKWRNRSYRGERYGHDRHRKHYSRHYWKNRHNRYNDYFSLSYFWHDQPRHYGHRDNRHHRHNGHCRH